MDEVVDLLGGQQLTTAARPTLLPAALLAFLLFLRTPLLPVPWRVTNSGPILGQVAFDGSRTTVLESEPPDE